MKGHAGQSGAYLIAWSQTTVDGHAGLPEAEIRAGAYWLWGGEAVDIGCLTCPDDGPAPDDGRRKAAKVARRRVGQALGVNLPEGPAIGERTITLTDGHETWTATLIDVPVLTDPLVLFAGRLPPAGVPLRVTDLGTVRKPPVLMEAAGVVCFTPGTWIETPGGARQIEHLAAGDKVMTLDGGAQELVWTGTRRVSLRELHRMPDLAPVRIREGALAQAGADGDLVVSPDHRLLVRRRQEADRVAVERLIAARDLVDGEAVRRELPVRPVTYVHLLLERHHILLANGFWSESFHPAAAALDAIPAPDRLRLFDIMPALKAEPQVYGPWARPVLSRAEAALVSAA